MKKYIVIIFIITTIMITACTFYSTTPPNQSPEEEQNQDETVNNDNDDNKEVKNGEDNKDEEENNPEEDTPPNFDYPDAVRGIYVTGNVAGGHRFNELIDLVDTTDLNAMVIDIKNDDGYITFKVDDPIYDEFSQNYIKDPEQMMETLAEHEIYPIARIVVFKDTVLARKNPDYSFLRSDGSVWRNNRNEAFVNPFLEEVWEHNLDIAKMAAELGFQEIQFDYVRFPEGFQNRANTLKYPRGDYDEESLTPRIIAEWEKEVEQEQEQNEQNTKYVDKPERELIRQEYEENDELETEKEELEQQKPPDYTQGTARVTAVTDFVEYASQELTSYDVDVSVDIFGYTATVKESSGIGQNFTKISEHIDIMSSMIYPRHWGPYNFGIPKPDLEPYQLVKEYAEKETEVLAQLDSPPISRPWLQDFTASWLGSGNYIPYGQTEVEAQVKALHDFGINEYLLWNASNKYTKNVDYLINRE